MLSKSQATKLLRKQKRCQAIISNETKLSSSEDPTKFLAVCNAGLSTGLQQETLLEEILKCCNLKDLLMIPNRSYCFLECYSIDDSIKIYNEMHGLSKLGQNRSILCLSYYKGIPEICPTFTFKNPSGLILVQDFINLCEEQEIIDIIESNENKFHNSLKHRFVKHYGYEFSYETNNVNTELPLEREIPKEFSKLWQRLKERCSNLSWYEPDQLTVNFYETGQGIPPHVDTHSAFLDPILSLSLNGDTVMDFRREDEHFSVDVPKRSLLIMTNESRYDWTHGITPRHMDIVPSELGGLTIRKRDRRISLTFRKLRRQSCDCIYPRLCDSAQKQIDSNKFKLIDLATKVELTNVHEVYDKIAEHFSETRHSPWPRVKEFVEGFSIGDIVFDIGCGNGKYLGINSSILKVGCDRSEGLLKVGSNSMYNLFKCDCLNLPIRSSSVNGCISIAVIHHLATEERRMKAILEMARILCTSGKALIYVWAKDQESDSNKSSYLKQNKALNKQKATENELRINNVQQNFEKTEISLPIHTNRTKFQDQDVLVPWKLKECSEIKLKENLSKKNAIFLRYYHVFEKNELENLCKKIKDVRVLSSYYDQGNWCVIFEKI